jgi:hypothetical protein
LRQRALNHDHQGTGLTLMQVEWESDVCTASIVQSLSVLISLLPFLRLLTRFSPLYW